MCTTSIIILNFSQNGKKNLLMWGNILRHNFSAVGLTEGQIWNNGLYYPHIYTSNPKKIHIIIKQKVSVL